MATIKVATLRLSLDFNILSYNDKFCQLFGGNSTYKHAISQARENVSFLTDFISYQDLNHMKFDTNQSFMLLRNNTNHKNALLFLYAIVTKSINGYMVRIINWLNWIHNLHASLEHSYSFVSDLNKTIEKHTFNQISDASCFKALYPLVTYIPEKFRNGISRGVLFDIMNLFVKQRSHDKISKDYSRNIYSRIRTSLKKDFNLSAVDVDDLIKNDKFVTLKYGDDIHIPHTTITHNLSKPVSHDKLLLNIINSIS